jgi:cellulose synthase/poly-beta-1,6-N-acetylglucosamine synthase-like glycosyltransferase
MVALIVASVLVALPGAAAALHLGLLAVASLGYRQPNPGDPPRVRFLVLVPAHNEEAVLGDALTAIAADRRPGDQTLVVADRCTDATASIARAHGALVLERKPWEAPGRAAARQAGIELALGLDWDAMVMIDADSVIEPGFFGACEALLATGAAALQARSEAADGGGLVARASSAAFALQGVTMPRGRDRLGLLVRLRGTGMVLRRQLVERFSFHAPASEDLFFSLDLCLAGYRPRHVDTARLRSANPGSWSSASDQRQRYEAGRMAAARSYLGRLLRRADPASLEAAWWLASPPFAVAAASLGAGLGLAGLAHSLRLSAVLAALLLLLAGALFVALGQTGASARTWAAVLTAPFYVAWKLGVQLRSLLRLRERNPVFGPTARR